MPNITQRQIDAPPSRRRDGRLRTVLTGLMLACFAGAGWLGLVSSGEHPAVTAAAPLQQNTNTESQYVTKNIEDIKVGMRLIADNPEIDGISTVTSAIDPSTWRVVRLRMQGEGDDVFDIELLRPMDWMNAVGAEVGESIHLIIEEQGLDGAAGVLAIEACPEIEATTNPYHRIVTGTFSHSRDVFEVRIASSSEPIGTTDNHPFWSEDRQAFVRADSLALGEQLRLANDDTVSVTHTGYRGVRSRVYNLEVDAEHVFFVGNDGILVHNNCGDWYHGTSSVAADDIRANGVSLGKIKQHGDVDDRGFFVTPVREDAEHYALNAAARDGGEPVIIQASSADIGDLLDDVPGALGGEKMIPADNLPIPGGIFH